MSSEFGRNYVIQREEGGMRVVITGGWGYGNLGDDAILNSTVENIKSAYPNCTIDILTYDLNDSMIHIAESVQIHKSVHAYVDFNSSELSYKKLEKDYSFFYKAFLQSKRYIVDSRMWTNISNFERHGKLAIEIIKDADLLVVAGGGYFNEKWMGSVIAHLVEMKAAFKFGVPFCVAGPTIGTFSDPKIKKLIMETFSKSVSIYVRDTFSLKQFGQENIAAKIIPDIVLSKWKGCSSAPSLKERPIVGLIFTNRDEVLRKKISSALGTFLSDHGNGSVKILLSRRWKQDFKASLAVQKDLESQGLCAEIVIPSSFYLLEDNLAECDIVMSENLHGLILASRNGVSIVAINDYAPGSPNYKKIVSFVTQTNSQNFVINSKTCEENVINMIYKSYLSNETFKESAKDLCDNVKFKSEIFFSDLKKYL